MTHALMALVAVVLSLVAFPASSAAGDAGSGAKYTLSLTSDYTSSSWTSEMGWSNRALGKLGFGLKNGLLGWTDLFVEPKEAIDEGGNVFVGIGAGVKDALENTLGGVVHTVTFPITSFDATLPEGGIQII